MQTKPLPEIEESDLKAVRNFLVSLRDEERKDRAPHLPADAKGAVTLRNGIARARMRSVAKTSA